MVVEDRVTLVIRGRVKVKRWRSVWCPGSKHPFLGDSILDLKYSLLKPFLGAQCPESGETIKQMLLYPAPSELRAAADM